MTHHAKLGWADEDDTLTVFQGPAMQPLTNIAVTAARRAGDVILSYYRRGDPGTVTEKHKNDYVTEADQHSESTIIDTIRRRHPDHAFLAEESGDLGESETQWIIDPIDGTMNFLRGIPHFCISIACRVRGVTEHAVIYDPVKDELFIAERGGGATLDGRRIRVAATTRLQAALLSTGFAYRRNTEIASHLPAYNRLLAASGHMRSLGAAALDLAYVAAGRIDGFWEFGLSPWDMAAGQLMVRTAGGIVTAIEDTDADPLATGNILAASPKVYPQLLAQLSEGGRS
jgi:myo-inositol-1(or 4)-monophosphatase